MVFLPKCAKGNVHPFLFSLILCLQTGATFRECGEIGNQCVFQRITFRYVIPAGVLDGTPLFWGMPPGPLFCRYMCVRLLNQAHGQSIVKYATFKQLALMILVFSYI